MICCIKQFGLVSYNDPLDQDRVRIASHMFVGMRNKHHKVHPQTATYIMSNEYSRGSSQLRNPLQMVLLLGNWGEQSPSFLRFISPRL